MHNTPSLIMVREQGPAVLIAWLFVASNFGLYYAGSSFPLHFKPNGEFRILQVADQHYANGGTTSCEDVLPSQFDACSDLNTTAFISRVIAVVNPDLIVFTGDNIFGADSNDSATSQIAAFAPAIDAEIPWVALLGNHDQEGTLNREQLMQQITGMQHSLSRLNPQTSFPRCGSPNAYFDTCHTPTMSIEGFGNNNLEVGGAHDSNLAGKSVLNLYFLDSGDYSTIPCVDGYGWIRAGQQAWFSKTSAKLQAEYTGEPLPQGEPAPALAYFHMPLPEFSMLEGCNMTGVKQEDVCAAGVNAGFFTTMLEAGDVKAAFIGHDHVNDFCGRLMGVGLCYAGGVGYHAYGLAGWPRRTRVVLASLEKDEQENWLGVNQIKTWKVLDDESLSVIDEEVLWKSKMEARSFM